MIGDGFGIRGAYANIDHSDTALVGADQVVARHLRQSRWGGAQLIHCLSRQAGAACDDIAGLDEGDVFAVLLGHFGMTQADEFVDVELVVGKQHKVLKPLGGGAGVMAQAVQ